MPTVGLGGSFSLISRESTLLVNNVLLVASAGLAIAIWIAFAKRRLPCC